MHASLAGSASLAAMDHAQSVTSATSMALNVTIETR